MTAEKSSPAEPFDLAWIKELIELMEAHGLWEVDLRKGDFQYKICRGPQGGATMLPPPVYAAAAPPVAASASPAAAAPAREDGLAIKSPTVGTFYAAPNPDDPPFVKVGTQVKPETIVCLVEAMKVFNQITSDVAGTVVEVCVKNGDPVEFGQVLFRVRPG